MTKKIFIISTILILAIVTLLIVVFSCTVSDDFEVTDFDVESVYSRMETLTSKPYYGRLTGSQENNIVLTYIENEFRNMGIESAGIDDTYYQPFSTIVAKIDPSSKFIISTNTQNVKKEFVLYQDYNLLTAMNAGGIDFFGELLFVKDKLYSTEAQMLKDRVIVIEAKELSAEHIDYVLQNGGKGIFCCADYENEGRQKKFELQKHLDISGKTGATIAAGYISNETYTYLQTILDDINEDKEEAASIINNVRIEAQIEYPVVDTANILGKIEGRSGDNEVLIIAANIDGAGWGVDGEYFEGAVRNASGISMLLEIARTISSQDSLPYQTVVFIGLNGQQQDFAGSKYYVNNPAYPLDKTSIIHIGAIGVETNNGLLIASDKSDDMVLRDIIAERSQSNGLAASKSVSDLCAISSFSEKGVAAVTLNDVNVTQNVYSDQVGLVDKSYLDNASKVLLDYIRTEVFLDQQTDSQSAWGKFTAVVGKPFAFIKNTLNSGTDTIQAVGENSSILRSAVLKSVTLLISALLLSIIIGIISGLLSGYRAKGKSLRSLGPILGLSIPDVLIILLGWRISRYYAMYLTRIGGNPACKQLYYAFDCCCNTAHHLHLEDYLYCGTG